MNPISRRTLLAAASLVLAGCHEAEGAYFGKTDPPDRQKLVAILGVEPGSLDPATSGELIEQRAVYALFEGLTTLYPTTGEAMAGMATHYDITSDGLRYTFYLRAILSRADPPGEQRRSAARILARHTRYSGLRAGSATQRFNRRGTVDPQLQHFPPDSVAPAQRT
jgi:hypothetical protein